MAARTIASRGYSLSSPFNAEGASIDTDAHHYTTNVLGAYRARTPGGIAWKLALVEAVLREAFLKRNAKDGDADDPWWHCFIQSALLDAIELERQRRPVSGADEAAVGPNAG